MNYSILLSLVSMLFAFVLLVNVKRNPLKNGYTGKLFTNFTHLCMIGPMLECAFFLIPQEYGLAKVIGYKIFLIEEIFWLNIFILLICALALDKKKNNKEVKIELKKINVILFIIFFGISLALIIAPTTFDYVSKLLPYVRGLSMKIFYFASLFYACLSLIVIFANLKTVSVKKYLPFILFSIIGIAYGIFQAEFQAISLLIIFGTLIEYVIYFVLEEN